MAFRTRSLVLACAVCALLASCRKRLPEPIQVAAEDQVFYSDESLWREEAGVVIRDLENWKRYWERVTGSKSDPPTVDFTSHMLLLFNAGKRYPGDRIQILELLPGEGELIARYRIEESGIRQSEVYPVQVVRVKRRAGQVRFQPQTVWDP